MELALVAGSIAAALVVAGLLRLLSNRTPSPGGPRHRVVVATATTVDGVTAHVQATYLLTVTDAEAAGPDVDAFVDVQLESGLRRLIAARTVAELPITGESADELLDAGFVGVRIEHLAVESTDVVVSPELRRLVVPRP